MRYATNPQYPPYDWEENGRYVGASIDLLQRVMPKDIRLEAVMVPWKRAHLLAQQGKVDLLVSLRITPEREKYLLFTTHRAFSNPIVVFMRKDKALAQLESWAALKPYYGGLSLGDTFGNGFDEYWPKELRMEYAPTMIENFEKLDLGRIDYFVTRYYLGQYYLRDHQPQHQPVVALSPPISQNDIHFGFSRLSPCAALVTEVSRRLRDADRQGIPEQLLQSWLTGKWVGTQNAPSR